MDFVFYLFIFLFGLIVGSFLNVVICRLETGETIIGGRSHCQCCGHILAWYDLIPVLSFLILGGKCRYCGKRISRQYPLVEISTALIFLLILNFKFQVSNEFLIFNSKFLIDFFYYLFITSALIVIFVYDLRHYIIPDKIIYPAIGVSAIYVLFGILEFSHLDLFENLKFKIENLAPIFNPFIAAAAVGALFLIIVILTQGKGMGGGDVKLAFLMGLILGWPKVLAALFLSFTAGAIYGIILILMRKKTLKSQVPFGPFLAAGTIATIFWGEEIVKWYGGYLL